MGPIIVGRPGSGGRGKGHSLWKKTISQREERDSYFEKRIAFKTDFRKKGRIQGDDGKGVTFQKLRGGGGNLQRKKTTEEDSKN